MLELIILRRESSVAAFEIFSSRFYFRKKSTANCVHKAICQKLSERTPIFSISNAQLAVCCPFCDKKRNSSKKCLDPKFKVNPLFINYAAKIR